MKKTITIPFLIETAILAVLFVLSMIFFSNKVSGQSIQAGIGLSSNRTENYMVSANSIIKGWGVYANVYKNTYKAPYPTQQKDFSNIADKITIIRCTDKKDYYSTCNGFTAGVNVELLPDSKHTLRVYAGLGNYDITDYRLYITMFQFKHQETQLNESWRQEQKRKVFVVEGLVSTELFITEKIKIVPVVGFSTYCWFVLVGGVEWKL